jgi:hypothetical protein
MSDSENAPVSNQNPEPTFQPGEADISHMAVISIHMNELYKHLQKHGFDKEEALHLTGMVLSSGILFKYDAFTDATLDIEDDQDFGDLGGEDFV